MAAAGSCCPVAVRRYALSVPSLDAATLRDAMARFRQALEEHRDEINSLNVYPVPDGDTGSNMLRTQQAVDEELQGLGDGDLRTVGSAIARAALMGARGNSGVILAQSLRGFVGRLDGDVDGGRLAEALDLAAGEAYRAVARPARGTILDVLADAAGAARSASNEGADAEGVAAAALDEGRASLDRARDILPVLRRAGVVDAGGKGIVLLLDSLHAAIAGEPMTERVGEFGPVGRTEGSRAASATALAFKFEVQFLLETDERGVAGLRSKLDELGDSLVIVGGGDTFRVHVHTNRPDEALALAAEAGRTGSVSVSDLEGDVERCLVGEVRGVRAAERQASALVAVADGDGISKILTSLGAAVVPGGPGDNLAVAEILRALDAAPSDHVVLLPNHDNVQPAARAAAEQAEAQVEVVPTRSIAQGVSAAAAFHPDRDLHANVRALEEAAEAVEWGEVARAVRDADTPAGPVRAGQLLAMDGGEVVALGDDAPSIVLGLVRRLRRGGDEVLTVFTGESVDEDEAMAVERRLREELTGLEIEIHPGGQPGYPYVIGLE